MTRLLLSVAASLTVAVSALGSLSAIAHDTKQPHSGGLQEVKARDGREILADSKALTVYTFAPDKADESVCYKGCAKEWPPVLVVGTEPLVAPYGTTTRTDGKIQVTYNHRPLYNYDDDKVQGDIFGDGKHDVWFVVEVK